MKHKSLLVALAVVLATVPAGVAATDVTGFPVLDVTLADDSVTPGEETTLQLAVSNSGRVQDGSQQNLQLNNRVTTARGVTLSISDKNAPIEVNTGTRSLGTLPEGTATTGFSISVDEDARPGTYKVPVTVKYTYTRRIGNNGDQRDLKRTRTFNVQLEVEEDANLDIVNVSSEARVGSTGTVAVTVENTGTIAAHDATLQLSSSNSALTFDGSTTASRSMGTWEEGERRTLRYETTVSSSAKEQSYAFDATLHYEDADGVEKTSEPQTFGITPAEQQTFAIESTESTVAVGDTGTVTVTMRNQGPISVSDATVKLSSNSADLAFGESSSATRFVGEWQANETRTLEYDITATDDADTRSYSLDATVTYLDEEDDTETAPTRSLGVTPEPEQSFTVGNVSSTLAVGKEGTLTGTVTNTGDTDVENAVVVFESEKANITPLESEAPVGDLASGESAEFSFPIEISDSAEAGAKQFTVSVQYRNQEDELRTSESMDIQQEVGPDDPEFTLETNGARVAPGKGTELEVTVTNNGEVTYSDISANMFADDPMSVNDDEAFISELGPGESKTIKFSVGASGGALEKTYPVSVDFQYDDSDGDTKLSDTYKVPVSVEETEQEQSGGGGPPLLLIVGALVVVVGAVYLFRRYRG